MKKSDVKTNQRKDQSMWKTMDEATLKQKKVADLKEIAKTFGLPGYAKMKKAELIEALMTDEKPAEAEKEKPAEAKKEKATKPAPEKATETAAEKAAEPEAEGAVAERAAASEGRKRKKPWN